ncbi:C3H1-type domain-containing protein [Mycena kentingensis (nom. inval.)]|nr:C3H1-type domain-containing protein [Mycena kentingensis (nom. inval.)]
MATTNPPPSKRYRCRYYTEDGSPVGSGCNNGDACRFVHPNDPQWPGKPPFVDTRDLKASHGNHPKRPKDGRGPLMPQSDLFISRKEEVRPRVDRDRDRDRHQSRARSRSLSPARQYSSRYTRPRTSSDSSKPNEVKVESDVFNTKDDLSSVSANKWGTQLRVPPTPHQKRDEGGADENKRAERLVELFRSLANLSNEIVASTAAHEKAGEKLTKYNEISSALSRISQAAATSVAPTLADIMLRHEQCKHRVDENFKALGGLWEEVFDVFVNEVVRVIDGKLENALVALKAEGETQALQLAATPSTGKRTREEDGVERSPLDKKRRRMGAAGLSSPGSDFEIMEQMRVQIDSLLKENNELKNMLK